MPRRTRSRGPTWHERRRARGPRQDPRGRRRRRRRAASRRRACSRRSRGSRGPGSGSSTRACFVLGPAAGEPDEPHRTTTPISYQGEPVGELVVDGAAEGTFLTRFALLISAYCPARLGHGRRSLGSLTIAPRTAREWPHVAAGPSCGGTRRPTAGLEGGGAPLLRGDAAARPLTPPRAGAAAGFPLPLISL